MAIGVQQPKSESDTRRSKGGIQQPSLDGGSGSPLTVCACSAANVGAVNAPGRRPLRPDRDTVGSLARPVFVAACPQARAATGQRLVGALSGWDGQRVQSHVHVGERFGEWWGIGGWFAFL
jgi:hypothetical protein